MRSRSPSWRCARHATCSSTWSPVAAVGKLHPLLAERARARFVVLPLVAREGLEVDDQRAKRGWNLGEAPTRIRESARQVDRGFCTGHDVGPLNGRMMIAT